VGPIRLRLATEERMRNANLSQEYLRDRVDDP
jgi:hypothetical protein